MKCAIVFMLIMLSFGELNGKRVMAVLGPGCMTRTSPALVAKESDLKPKT